MIDLGNVAALGVFAFAFGTFWYEFLRRSQSDKLRVTAISLFGIVVAETIVADGVAGGPMVLGLHPFAALIASFTAVYLDVAWQERKLWPWTVIKDLQLLARPFKAVPRVKVSVGGDESEKAPASVQKAA